MTVQCTICEKYLHHGVEYLRCMSCGFVSCPNCEHIFGEKCPDCKQVKWDRGEVLELEA